MHTAARTNCPSRPIACCELQEVPTISAIEQNIDSRQAIVTALIRFVKLINKVQQAINGRDDC